MKTNCKEENLILGMGGELVTLNFNATYYEPICEFIYDGMFFSIAETETDDWEVHYNALSDTNFEIDIIDWNWELIDIIEFYIGWVDTFRNESYYQYGGEF